MYMSVYPGDAACGLEDALGSMAVLACAGMGARAMDLHIDGTCVRHGHPILQMRKQHREAIRIAGKRQSIHVVFFLSSAPEGWVCGPGQGSGEPTGPRASGETTVTVGWAAAWAQEDTSTTSAPTL